MNCDDDALDDTDPDRDRAIDAHEAADAAQVRYMESLGSPEAATFRVDPSPLRSSRDS